MSPPDVLVGINSYVYNTVAAATFVSWDYCLTVGEEIEYIWRRRWTRVTTLFTIIRYISVFYSNLLMANNIAQFVPTSHVNCVALWVVSATCSMALVLCCEILFVMRVLALYGRNRLMRNGLITLVLCVNIVRIVLLAITIPQYRYERYVYSNIHQECHMTKFPSINPSSLYIVGVIPEAVLVCLAIIRLVQAKKTYNIPVSNLAAVIVRDGTWGFVPLLVFSVWNSIQYELAPQNGYIGIIWLYPLLGIIGSRSILDLRSEASLPPGNTDVETLEIRFARVYASASDD